MEDVVIYTTRGCVYTELARRLLQRLEVPFDEIDVTDDPQRYREMVERTHGARCTPQIFIWTYYVGGYDELKHLDETGVLDNMLGLKWVLIAEPSS